MYFIFIIYFTGSVANEEVGLPLRIFGRGNLCHPYLSLSYIDALSQPCVRGYIIGKFRNNNRKWIMHHIVTNILSSLITLNYILIIGATNALFKQKSGVAEVIIDIEKDKIDIMEPELKKALQLTTEDLRFIDFIIKQVSIENGSDIFLGKFQVFLLCL